MDFHSDEEQDFQYSPTAVSRATSQQNLQQDPSSSLSAINSRQRFLQANGIRITDAIKVSEGGQSFVVYCISVGDEIIRRRYSEFESVRKILLRLYPHCIIPPIPEKHSIASYAKKQSKAKDDPTIIELRKRMLERFLNSVANHAVLGAEQLFHRFLEPGAWADVLFSQRISKKQGKSLPLIGKKLRNPDLKFLEFEHENETFGIRTDSSRKDFKHTQKNLHELSLVYAELGAVFNAFSLHETSNQSLSRGIEQLGQALDSAHLCTNTLISELDSEFGDDLKEFQQYSKVIESLLKLRTQKHAHYEDLGEQIDSKRIHLANLEKDPNLAPSSQSQASSNSSFGRLVKSGLQSLGEKISSAVDSDPESTRRSNIAKTRDQIIQLEKAKDQAHAELGKFSELVQRELETYNKVKAENLKRLGPSFCRVYSKWLRKGLEDFEEALKALESINHRSTESY